MLIRKASIQALRFTKIPPLSRSLFLLKSAILFHTTRFTCPAALLPMPAVRADIFLRCRCVHALLGIESFFCLCAFQKITSQKGRKFPSPQKKRSQNGISSSATTSLPNSELKPPSTGVKPYFSALRSGTKGTYFST